MIAIQRLVGVYDANAGLIGELSYVLKARLGGAHCSLCDITHGRLRERADWRSCRDELPVPFETYHRNDQPEAVRVAVEGQAPVVVAETSAGHVVLLHPEDIEAAGGSPEALVDAIRAAAARRHLVF